MTNRLKLGTNLRQRFKDTPLYQTEIAVHDGCGRTIGAAVIRTARRKAPVELQSKEKPAIHRAMAVVAIAVLSPLWIPLIVLWLIFYALASLCIYIAVWLLWLPRSKHILFVYSDSPVWHDYIQQHILPVIREQAVILNWSERSNRTWKLSLAVAAFKHFGGRRDFNPMAVVFRPCRRAKVFRFHVPFRDYKHGKPEKLLTILQEFLDYAHVEGQSGSTIHY